MADYPLIVNLSGRLAVVVGAGPVGRRKIHGLLAAGARVRLIASRPVAESYPETVEIHCRCFRGEDLDGASLVFAATDSPQVNRTISEAARARKIWVCVVDAPDQGDFSVPALLRRGDLTVAVATGGQSPALAALLRDRLASLLGPEWGTVLELAAQLRQKRLTASEKTEYNQAILRRLLDSDLVESIARGDVAAIDRTLESVLGQGCSLAQLGIHLPKGLP